MSCRYNINFHKDLFLIFIVYLLLQQGITGHPILTARSSAPQARHAIPAMLSADTALTWTNTSPVSHPVVSRNTSPSTPRPRPSNHSDTAPSSIDSVVMVPFFQVADSQTRSHRYVCAAKYLGFYTITDRGN